MSIRVKCKTTFVRSMNSPNLINFYTLILLSFHLDKEVTHTRLSRRVCWVPKQSGRHFLRASYGAEKHYYFSARARAGCQGGRRQRCLTHCEPPARTKAERKKQSTSSRRVGGRNLPLAPLNLHACAVIALIHFERLSVCVFSSFSHLVFETRRMCVYAHTVRFVTLQFLFLWRVQEGIFFKRHNYFTLHRRKQIECTLKLLVK